MTFRLTWCTISTKSAQFYYKNLAQKTQRKPHCHAVAHVLCVFPWTIFRFWETIGICFSKGKYFMADRAHHLLFFFMLRVSKLGGRYRERQWFCQKIWDRKHMKSTDRENFPLYCCHFHATNPLPKSKKLHLKRSLFPEKHFQINNKESLCLVPLKSRCHAWYQYTSCSKAICVYLWVHTQICVSDIKHSGIGNQFWYVSTRNLQCTNRQSKPDSFPCLSGA